MRRSQPTHHTGLLSNNIRDTAGVLGAGRRFFSAALRRSTVRTSSSAPQEENTSGIQARWSWKLYVVSVTLLLFSLGAVTFASSHAGAVDVFGNCDANDPACTSALCNNPNATSKPAICNDTAQGQSNPLLGSDGLLTKIVRILSFIVGVAALIVIIISGLRMVVSGGNPNSVATARSSLIYALVGLAVAALAQVIVIFILNKLG